MNIRFEMALVMQCAGIADVQQFLSDAKLLPTRPRCFASDRYALLTWDHSVPAALQKRAKTIIWNALNGAFDTRHRVRSPTMCYVRAHQVDDTKHHGDVTVVGYAQTYKSALCCGALPRKAMIGQVQSPEGSSELHYGVEVEIPSLMSEVSRASIMKMDGQKMPAISKAELHALLW